MSGIVPRTPPKQTHLSQSEIDRISKLLSERRFCYVIAEEDHVPGKGYRASLVIENESGRFPTGAGDVEPWFWGETLNDARAVCAKYNLDVLKLNDVECAKIVASTMFHGRGRGKRSRRSTKR